MNHNRKNYQKKKKVRPEAKENIILVFYIVWSWTSYDFSQHIAFFNPNGFLLKLPLLASWKFQYLLK